MRNDLSVFVHQEGIIVILDIPVVSSKRDELDGFKIRDGIILDIFVEEETLNGLVPGREREKMRHFLSFFFCYQALHSIHQRFSVSVSVSNQFSA